MKKLIALFSLALLPALGTAAGGGNVHLEQANIDLNNHAAIQRGAKYVANYCSGCHSTKYVRYSLMTKVGLTEDDVRENLIFDDSKVLDLMKISMPANDAAGWFGATPPDLTLTARIRHGGADWLYTYLKGFYTDPSRPLGANNTLFPNVGMPNVLWELQGIQEPVYRYDVAEGRHTVASFETELAAQAYIKENGATDLKLHQVVDHLVMTRPGKLTPAEFDQVARDIAAYLAYISEPMKLERQRLGVWVLLFLGVFSIIAYLMKKEWWKDIH